MGLSRWITILLEGIHNIVTLQMREDTIIPHPLDEEEGMMTMTVTEIGIDITVQLKPTQNNHQQEGEVIEVC